MRILASSPDRVVIEFADGALVNLLFRHADRRRTIWEGPYETGVAQCFAIHVSNLPLAMHYHRLTKEIFTIVNGGGYVLTSSVNENGVPIDAEGSSLLEKDAIIAQRKLRSGDVVEVNPFLAHTFYLRPRSEMVCIASLPFDMGDILATPWLVKENMTN